MERSSVKSAGLGLFAAVCVFIFAASGFCEEAPYGHEFDTYIRYMPGSEAEAMPGEVEIIEAGIEYSYAFKAWDKLPVKFSLENQYISIDENVGVQLPSHLFGLSIDIETTVPFFSFEDTYWRFGLKPSFYDDDAEFESSAFRIPFRTFIIHRPNDKLTLIAGVAVYPDFESQVVPIVGLIYKPSEALTFNLVPKKPNITYQLNERMSIFAEGSMWGKEFEVDKGNLENVVLKVKGMRLAGGIRYKFNEYIRSSISVGGAFNRTLKYRDSLGKVNLEDGLFTELRVKIRL
ncbi:hypothetical protein ACFL1K_01065 [Candidatus Omnitrophota bacterium]